MPTDAFWQLAGLGVAFVGWGVMRYLSAKWREIDARAENERSRLMLDKE